jgi:hypothetical protein
MNAASASPPAPPATVPSRRPFGIVVLALLFLVRAALLLLALAAPSLPDAGLIARLLSLPFEIASAVREDPIAAGIVVGLAVAMVVAGLLMWRRRRTGWRIGILVTGFFLVIDLYLASRGTLHPIWTALDVVTVFYLNQRDVRDYFAVGRTETGP